MMVGLTYYVIGGLSKNRRLRWTLYLCRGSYVTICYLLHVICMVEHITIS